VEPWLDRFDIRPRDLDAKVGKLSGGNQQKVIIARELSHDVSFLLAAYPTRGVDIGAIEFIYDLILKQRASGTGVLLISSELDELMTLSDRIAVLFEGRIVGEVNPQNTTAQEIGLLMTGGHA
jgi:simple sugar transport system ATP-binding protein